MSYRNPQIVQPAKVGEIYGAGIAQFGKNISKGIDAYALKQEKIRKEQEAELKKQQNLYNQVDFEKAKMSANFTQKTRDYQLSSQLKPIADNAIKQYGDAKIALLTETNPQNRAYYNKLLQDSYSTLINAEAYVKALQGDIGEYISINNAQEIGITKGIAATGADAIINQEFMQNISAMSDSGTIKMNQLEDGSIDLTAYRKDGSEIRTLNSAKYLQSGNSLIYDIPATDVEFLKDVDKQILTNKGNIKKEFLSDPKSRIIKTDAGSFNQFYETVDVDAIVKASSSTLVGQVAAYNAMTAQQKEDVWANQLGENRSDALTATDEDIAAAYQNLLVQSLKEQDAFDNFDGKLVSVGKMTKITPPTPQKETADTRKEKTRKETITTVYENIQEASPSLGISMNNAGVFTGDVELIINEDGTDVINPQVEEALDRIGLETVEFIGPDDNEKVTDAIKIKLAGTPDTKAIEFKKSISAQEFINKVLKLSGAKPGEAKDIGYQFKPPTQDEMNAADLLQKYTTK
jgi:hypothetical protein